MRCKNTVFGNQSYTPREWMGRFLNGLLCLFCISQTNVKKRKKHSSKSLVNSRNTDFMKMFITNITRNIGAVG